MGSLVSLVMSDIVDSTRRWNAAEGAMAADLELHDRLIREVVEGAGGTVFKHTGDGMIAVFDDPVAAAGAAAGIQQAIGSAQWQQPDGLQVRAAVHTGVVYPRDGDLFGTAVNKVARLLAVCPPGAVLVSGATTGLLADRAPEGMVLQPVGPVDLAGFATPDDAHALVGDDATGVVISGTATGGRRAEIPSIDDELVGRVDELAAIWDALGRTRLVTLVGVGGMGKTRLALEVAAGAVDAFDGGVWWIDLTNATTADAVIPVAMAATGTREIPGRTALQALCDRFKSARGVIVLDNCEHVLGAARELVAAWRGEAPDIRMVATSREGLGLRGEHLVPVGSLAADDGVRLFCERAVAVQHDVDVDASLPVIRKICARLDGIPLAIELAAARCRSMTPAEIDARLDERFRLLRGGREGAERHRTMQAAVAWSYEMLDADERVVFDRMAVFADGALIDGLAAVVGRDEFDVIDTVERLIARSMVATTRSPLGTRYHQLETLRQYAEDRLVEAGTIDEVRDRHLSWMLQLADRLAAAHGLEAEAASLARLAAEVDNLRVAVAHAVGTGRFETAYELIARLGMLLIGRNLFEAADWVRPFPADHVWSTASADCAAFGVMADQRRGLPVPQLRSATDLPGWYRHASERERSSALVGLGLGPGNAPFVRTLLDDFQPVDDFGRIRSASARLFLEYPLRLAAGPGIGADGGTEADELIDLAASTVAAARLTGNASLLVAGLACSAIGLSIMHPRVATRYSVEALALAERLGDLSFAAAAISALGLTGWAGLDQLPNGLLPTIRDRVRTGLVQQNPYGAGVVGAAALPLVGRHDPALALAFCDAWERQTGRNLRPLLVRWGVFDQLGDTPTPEVPLLDVMGAVAELLDRLIAEAEAEAGASAGGSEG